MKKYTCSIFLVVLFMFNYSYSQSIWHQWSENMTVRVEYLNSTMHSSLPGFKYTNQTLILSGKYPLGKIVRITAEVPMILEQITTPLKSSNESGIGNFLIGCELGDLNSPICFEAGVRPVLRKETEIFGLVGYFGDYGRGEIYTTEMRSYFAVINVKSVGNEGFVYRLRFGPTVLLPVNGDAITMVDYGLKIGYEESGIGLFTGITGRWNTKENEGKTAYHYAGLDGGYRVGSIRPALFYRIPLDKENKRLIKQTLGVTVSMEL